MKALITAAGKGTRMNFSTPTNKTLLNIGGKSLLQHSLGSFRQCGINDIYIITGYCAEEVKKEAGSEVVCINNPDYASTGIIYSINCAKEKLYGHSFILMMGDLFHDSRMVSACVEFEGDIVVTYEEKDNYVPEDSKAIVDEGKIRYMSKDIPPQDTSGEFGHMMKLSEAGSKIFFNEIESFIERGHTKVYLMDVINEIVSKGMSVDALNVTGIPRIEIDFQEDLEEAKLEVFPLINK